MGVEINNLTEVEVNGQTVSELVSLVMSSENAEGNVSIALVGPGRMKKLNKKYRGRNKVASILSFPEHEVEFGKFVIGDLKESKSLGEIVVCLREAKKIAKRSNIPLGEELARLLIHGTLHLLGFTHIDEKSAAEMRKKEDYYLSRAKAKKLIPD